MEIELAALQDFPQECGTVLLGDATKVDERFAVVCQTLECEFS